MDNRDFISNGHFPLNLVLYPRRNNLLTCTLKITHWIFLNFFQFSSDGIKMGLLEVVHEVDIIQEIMGEAFIFHKGQNFINGARKPILELRLIPVFPTRVFFAFPENQGLHVI